MTTDPVRPADTSGEDDQAQPELGEDEETLTETDIEVTERKEKAGPSPLRRPEDNDLGKGMDWPE